MKFLVSCIKYEKPFESVKMALDSIQAFQDIPDQSRIFIKPNIVVFPKGIKFPKWGVITTSRVIFDIVRLLYERGLRNLSIGEGIITNLSNDHSIFTNACATLGYSYLEQQYGVKLMDIFERPFTTVDLGDGIHANLNCDALNADFIINVPTLKTHSQTQVSLGIKNLKGLLDIPSRKNFHNQDPILDLDFRVAKLADKIPSMVTIIDGIFSLERGPMFDGKAHRLNVLIASKDVLSADIVGAQILGFDPTTIPLLQYAAKARHRVPDMNDIQIKGSDPKEFQKPHSWQFLYNESKTLPLPFQKAGIKGLNYYEYDNTLCTYCSSINGMILSAIYQNWTQRQDHPFDDVEVLTGKRMNPRPEMKKTILVGQCMYKAHKDNPNIQELIAIKGCPPNLDSVQSALEKAGISVPREFFTEFERSPEKLYQRYMSNPEFDDLFYSPIAR